MRDSPLVGAVVDHEGRQAGCRLGLGHFRAALKQSGQGRDSSGLGDTHAVLRQRSEGMQCPSGCLLRATRKRSHRRPLSHERARGREERDQWREAALVGNAPLVRLVRRRERP